MPVQEPQPATPALDLQRLLALGAGRSAFQVAVLPRLHLAAWQVQGLAGCCWQLPQQQSMLLTLPLHAQALLQSSKQLLSTVSGAPEASWRRAGDSSSSCALLAAVTSA